MALWKTIPKLPRPEHRSEKSGFSKTLTVSIPQQSTLKLSMVGAKRRHGWMKHRVSYGKTYRKCLGAQARNSTEWVVFVGLQAGWNQEYSKCPPLQEASVILTNSGKEVWAGIAQGINSLKVLMVSIACYYSRTKTPSSLFFLSIVLFGTVVLIKRIIDSCWIKINDCFNSRNYAGFESSIR